MERIKAPTWPGGHDGAHGCTQVMDAEGGASRKQLLHLCKDAQGHKCIGTGMAMQIKGLSLAAPC